MLFANVRQIAVIVCYRLVKAEFISPSAIYCKILIRLQANTEYKQALLDCTGSQGSRFFELIHTGWRALLAIFDSTGVFCERFVRVSTNKFLQFNWPI